MRNPLARHARPYTYRRPAAGSWVDGRWQEGTLSEPQTFRASIQPLRGFEILLLPEGQRGKALYWIYTEAQLQVLDEPAGLKGDRVQFGDRELLVIAKEPWVGGFNYFAYKGQMIEKDSEILPPSE